MSTWHPHTAKRRRLEAYLSGGGGRYHIAAAAQPLGRPEELIATVRRSLDDDSLALVGLDLPLGLPRRYAQIAKLERFREALAKFGRDRDWRDFFRPSNKPTVNRPFAPRTKTQLTQGKLAEALLLHSPEDLFRRCDHKTALRNHLDCMFLLTHAEHTGRSARVGWERLIGPEQHRIRIWPFDGSLSELATQPGIIVAEVHPVEAVAQLQLPLGPKSGLSKRNRDARQRASSALLEAARRLQISMAESVLRHVRAGFASEQDFDALIALVAVIRVLRGQAPIDPPREQSILDVEGWILGQDHTVLQRPKKPRASLDRSRAAQREHSYFIRRLLLQRGDRQESLDLAIPEATRGAVNVVCGLNNAGKSFLLDQLWRVLKRKHHRAAIEVDPRPARKPRVLFLGKAWEDKETVGTVNLQQTLRGLDLRGAHGDHRRTGLSLLLAQMAPFLPSIPASELPERIADPDVRKNIESIFKLGQVYRCDRGSRLVQRIERLVNGSLYFRCTRRNAATWEFQFVLAHDNGSMLPFDEWSDGQRACFYVLASLDAFRPELILFDEIETHLHPAFISEVIEMLRDCPAQSIISTHHPHLIFSRFVDSVFYVEAHRPGPLAKPPLELPYERRYSALQQDIVRIETDLERISSAYKLFAVQDDQLMRQAAYVTARATSVLVGAVSALFTAAPAPAKPGSLPDAQTQQLAERIATFARLNGQSTIDLLDLGAGIGRQVLELRKLSQWQLGTRVRWTCFEPIPSTREVLRQQLAGAPGIAIVDDLETLRGRVFDFSVVANVLHELTPPEFALYIDAARRHVDHQRGGILILELFPLVHPERSAVPYDAASLQDILDACGFSVEIEQISLRSGTVAHCALARERVASTLQDIAQHVDTVWSNISNRSLSAYALDLSPTTLAGYQRLLSHLTTIASIASWRAGKWQPRWTGRSA